MNEWTLLEKERPQGPVMVKRHTGDIIANATIVKNSAGNMEFWQVGTDEDQRYLLNPKVDRWQYDTEGVVTIPLGEQVQAAAAEDIKVDFETGEEVVT